MNETITIDGKEYEVLTLDDLRGELSFQLYVRLASGEVKTAEYFHRSEMVGIKVRGDRYDIGKHYIEPFGIQPLKLIKRKPVEVIGKFTGVEVYEDYEVAQFMVPLGTGKAIGRKMDMKLVQITEEV